MKACKLTALVGLMTAALALFPASATERGKVLFFTAHPDDLASSVGTILLMRDKFDVHVCNFAGGVPGVNAADDELRKEGEAVCRELGATLHWYDATRDSRWVEREPCERFARFLAELKPRAVFGHWPVGTHSDHVMSCAVLQKAVQLAQLDCEFYFFEALFESKGFLPAYYVDITSMAKDKKRILRLFKSRNKDDLLVKYEMRNSATCGERMNLFDEESGFSLTMHCSAEQFAVYGGRPQGPIIFAELPLYARAR